MVTKVRFPFLPRSLPFTNDRMASPAVQHLRTLLKLVFTNSEARKLLADISLIGRDLFARGAAKAAESARPDQDRLARVDDAAPSQQWVGPDGSTSGPHEDAPDVLTDEQYQKGAQAVDTAKSARNQYQDVKSQGIEVASDAVQNSSSPSEALGNAQQSANGRDINVDTNQIPDEHRERANAAIGSGQQLKDDVANAPEDEQADVAKRGLKDRMFGLKDKIPQEHRDKANDQYNQGVQFLKDEFPEERRDQVRVTFFCLGLEGFVLTSLTSFRDFVVDLPPQEGHRRMPKPQGLPRSPQLVHRRHRDLRRARQDPRLAPRRQGRRRHGGPVPPARYV